MEEVNEKRTRCEIYQRVTGYHRPVSHYNIGKKSEFYSRKTFNLEQSLQSLENINFNNQYL